MDADVGRLTNSIVYPSKLIIYTMFFPLFTVVHEYFFSSSTELPAVIHSRQKKNKQKNTYLRIVLTIQSITLYKNVICFLRTFGVFYDYAFASLLSEFIRPRTKHCAHLLPVTWHLQLSRLKE